jgi:hypothetical protein
MDLITSAFALAPQHTTVFCAHEYTESNLKFLASVDPEVSEVFSKRSKRYQSAIKALSKRYQNVINQWSVRCQRTYTS